MTMSGDYVTGQVPQGTGPDPDDGTGLVLDAFAGLQASIGTLSDEVAKSRRSAEWRNEVEMARLPIDAPLFFQAVANASGIAVINLLGPAEGRQWEVRRLGVSGVTPETTAAGAADMYEYAGQINPNQLPGLQGWAYHLSALPAVQTFSARQFVIHEGSNLQVVITVGTNGQTYCAVGLALDYPVRPAPTSIIL